MAAIQEYKCPCCGGAITFDSTVQKMKCPYCGSEFDVQALAENDEIPEDQMEWNMSDTAGWQEDEVNGFKTYVCNSCGGEIVADENTAATFCPFCGNPVIMTGQLKDGLRPDYVIPFKLDKDAAKEALMKHYNGKKLLPKVFKDQNHIDEVKGVYVPFWLFDADVDAVVRYKATKTSFWSDSEYDYSETSVYQVHRGGSIGFTHIPVDGSLRMDDAMMESIEPFDFSDAVDFETAYLSGYFADKYDVDADASIGRANERIKQSVQDMFAATVTGYETVTPEASGIRFTNSSKKYALYPVWLLNTRWNGNSYMFAMNGQTGKLVGDLPMDKKAYARWFFSIWAIATVLVFLLLFLILYL